MVIQEGQGTPTSPHLLVSSEGASEPRWLTTLDEIFPCARIIFSMRRDTSAQAQSAFLRETGVGSEKLIALNAAAHRFQAARPDRSTLVTLEDFTPDRFSELARWVGFECEFFGLPHANNGGYSSDYMGSQLTCSQSNLSSSLTFGIKHTSDYPERRRLLQELLHSIRWQYSDSRAVIAYDGKYAYPERQNERDVYIQLTGAGGLSAGRNMIVQHTRTAYVMIMEDDMVFHPDTHVETLIGHLTHNPELSLVSACLYDLKSPNPCYAHNFSSMKGRHIQTSPVHSSRPGLNFAQLVSNVFVARTEVLREHM